MAPQLKMNEEILLVQNGYIAIPELENSTAKASGDFRLRMLGTVFSNFAHYGYIPSLDATQKIMSLSDEGLISFWKRIKPALAHVSGEDKNMDKHVVYKNFPKEVLEMSEAQYWTNQILMYWGLPNDLFTQKVKLRPPIVEKGKQKVLDFGNEETLSKIFVKLCKVSASWTVSQDMQARYLVDKFSQLTLDMSEFAHKENGAKLIAESLQQAIDGRRKVTVSSATDVLRIASALSQGDASLRVAVKFKRFTRAQRRFLVNLLETNSNIGQDFIMRPEPWKRLLSLLHPGDFKAEKVQAAYEALYTKKLRSTASRIEAAIDEKNENILQELKGRPGEFARRLHKMYDLFGRKAFEAFAEVTDDLTVSQLVKLERYLQTIGDRSELVVTPKGKWFKAQFLDNTKSKIFKKDLLFITSHISSAIGDRLNALYPDGFDIDPQVAKVKLQSNGQELASYGRGTEFSIPDNINFIRAANYWKTGMKSGQNVWFDVGFNFYDGNWNSKDTISWYTPHPRSFKDAAVFSGDPTSSKDMLGRACQMIDLYPDGLVKKGVRYAVWSVLCYSRVPFSKVEDVFSTIQWGEDASAGKLYEPSRAQVAFPLTGDGFTKFVAMFDLVERKFVFLDLDLKAEVRYANANEQLVKDVMPKILRSFDTQPSILDVFSHGKKGSVPILYSDEHREVTGSAYVFERLNAENNFVPLNLEELLNAKGDVVEDKYIARFGASPGI